MIHDTLKIIKINKYLLSYDRLNRGKILNIYNNLIQSDRQITKLEPIKKSGPKYIILDIRAQNEQEDYPLVLDNNIPILALPFYNLGKQFGTLDQSKLYLLYCDHGIMSRLQLLYLREKGFSNVEIYCK